MSLNEGLEKSTPIMDSSMFPIVEESANLNVIIDPCKFSAHNIKKGVEDLTWDKFKTYGGGISNWFQACKWWE